MTHETLREKIDSLAAVGADLRDEDFLLTWEQPESAIRAVLTAAGVLEGLVDRGLSTRLFDTGLGLSIFRDKSTRTRYAFRSACSLLGLTTEELDESTSQIAHGETVRETAAIIGFLTEVVGIRDDIFLGEGHKYMTEVAESLDETWRGTTGSRPSPSTGSPILGGRRATTAGCAPDTRSSTWWPRTSRPRVGARGPARISRSGTPFR